MHPFYIKTVSLIVNGANQDSTLNLNVSVHPHIWYTLYGNQKLIPGYILVRIRSLSPEVTDVTR